mmetsp:Transcript_29089/g.43962  ORF Transcript_29089/g.43962 Transcript_29089/m.43962 type:complete len:110 (-) Transcript_29089:1701-2030(-)
MGELDDAMCCLLGALRIRRRVFDKKEKENVPTMTTTTNTTTTMPDVIVNDASSIDSKENTESNPLVLNTKLAIGIVHQKRGDLEEAFSSFQSVLQCCIQQLGHDHHSVA